MTVHTTTELIDMDPTNDALWADMHRRGWLEQARVDAAKLTLTTFVASVAATRAAAEAAAEAVGERLIIGFEQGQTNG
jgi:hypothetical protein